MKILSIETSCDETAIALLDIQGEIEKPEIKILGNTLNSQAKLHEEFGGVFPALAKREHQKNLPILLTQTLKEAGEDPEHPQIDCIAVTTGPGLEPALWTGIVFARDLAATWGKPVVAVNHMAGHIYSVLIQDEFSISNSQFSKLTMPALALLVSGGHTELVAMKAFGQYEILGKTVDDAAGEAFDKVARMLGFPYPGGPKISELAAKNRLASPQAAIEFPRPMIHSKDLNFSFSGLKTAVLYKLKAENRTDDQFKEEIARGFEDAVIEVLTEKTRTALDSGNEEYKSLILAGGVAANTRLQESFQALSQDFPGLNLFIPSKLLTTDNAIMIALAAYVKAVTQPDLLSEQSALKAEGNLSF